MMIFTLIGMLLLFCTAMLLLSLIVSSLVELLQKILRWRYTILKVAMTALSQHASLNIKRQFELAQSDNVNTVQRDLEKIYHALLQPLIAEEWFRGFKYVRTHVSLDELHKATITYVKQSIDLPYNAERSLKEELGLIFSRLEIEMKERYRRKTHVSALLVALLVSFCLQLNAFVLIENGIKKGTDFNQATLKMLATECKLSKEIQDVEITCLANQLFESQVIKPMLFPHGSHYYYPTNNEKVDWKLLFSRLVGMLACIILMSLGAPFWFERLKNIYSVHSKLK